jgi:hypothetical protein
MSLLPSTGESVCEDQAQFESLDARSTPWYNRRFVKPAGVLLAFLGVLAGALLANRRGWSVTPLQGQRGSFQTAYQAISDSLDASTAAPSTQLGIVPLTMGANADQQDTQQTSDLSGRFVTRDMAQVPGISKAQLDVRMVGQEIAGNHVVGHLATLANPVGRVQLALPPNGCGSRELTTVTAKSHRPFCKLAINAGYFNVTDGACIGNVVSHGQIVQTVPLAQGNVNFGVKDGKFYVGYLMPEEMEGFEMLVSGVVWLVRNGKNNVDRGWKEANITVQTSGSKYATNLASRTAVGYDAQGRLIIVQVDGSIAVGDNKRGMDMKEVANLLIQHGAVEAINLDGGGSSAMAHNGVLINYPSDNRPPSCDKSGLFQCERPVSTVLCIHELEGLASSSNGAFIGMSLGMYLAAGGLLFALGALGSMLFIRYGNHADGFERQLSTESTVSVRDVRKT